MSCLSGLSSMGLLGLGFRLVGHLGLAAPYCGHLRNPKPFPLLRGCCKRAATNSCVHLGVVCDHPGLELKETPKKLRGV